ncbi:extracellular solute-binding protein [Pseudomonas sp. N040]|uniref:extracellular solute-binding protein n=1 Tax=Pseudomonas sp. N040 TaxID=2785325 RepID=UPI0018A2E9B8|nr:extracellular solute-binding protein [Pseudomonas sp. N040]MBF7731543.1 extracellular solute-binding protein [Pseudomonas sp. N040]MBW7015187.1 extracellular solute-binding protein [Pseudomonas sp. N040]
MKPRALLTAIALGLVAAGVQAATAQPQVNLYIWNEYEAPDTLSSFEAKTGIKVVSDHFDSMETVDTKLMTGHSGYDLVLTSGQHLSRAISSGALQALDKSRLPNFKQLDPWALKHMQGFDAGNRYAGIYMWGTTGFGYQQQAIDKRMANAPLDSWAMLLDPQVVSRFADCGVSFLNDPNEVFAATFKYLGLDINRQNLADLKLAEAHLAKVRPHIRYFDNDRNIADLANGDTCLAMAWNGNVALAASQAGEAGKPYSVKYQIPKEGTVLWFDAVVIPQDAPHPEAAHALLDHLMTPAVIAGVTNAVYYANAVPAANPLVDPAILNDPGTYPPAAVQANLYVKNDNSREFDRALTRAFSRLKSGQ